MKIQEDSLYVVDQFNNVVSGPFVSQGEAISSLRAIQAEIDSYNASYSFQDARYDQTTLYIETAGDLWPEWFE